MRVVAKNLVREIVGYYRFTQEAESLIDYLNASGEFRNPMLHIATSPSATRAGMPTQLVIRPMQFDDLGEVVRIHIVAFPKFFLTRMGERFLRAYYTSVLEFPKSVAIVAESISPQKLSGFAVGFTDPGSFYAYFSGQRRRLMPAMFISLLRSPTLISEMLRNTLRVSAQAEFFSDAAELSSIAVDANGRGIGSALLRAFLDTVATTGIPSVVLTTDADNNDKTRQFYERHGFALDGYEQRGGRLLCRYSKSC